jgi:hypothetical protein
MYIAQAIPASPQIVKPKHGTLISVSSLGSNEGNYHDVEVSIDSLPLRPFIASLEEARCFRLLLIVDGFKRFTFDWSWPQSLSLSLRLGTHLIDVGLEYKEDGQLEWQTQTRFDRSVFDVIPAYNESVITSFDSPTDIHPNNHRDLLPPSKAFQCSTSSNSDSKEKMGQHKVRIALIGSLQLSGQNLLALEQGRRLRDLCILDESRKKITSFEVSYFSNAKSGPFVDLLRESRCENILSAMLVTLCKCLTCSLYAHI